MNSSQSQQLYSHEKENMSEESNSFQENHVKRQLYEQMKKQGILDGLKSQLRGKLYDQLKLRNDKVDVNFRELGSNRLVYKLGVSIMADFMQKCDMPYAMSVFLPESGIQQEILSKKEAMEVLRLDRDEQFSSRQGVDHTPLLMDILEVIKANNGAVKGNMVSSYVQTEEAGEESMNLDQKLRKVEFNFMEQAEIQKCLPFKSLEERMVRYRKECEQKFQHDLETEVRRLKEFEMSKIRMDEAQKYRAKLQEYRDEMEQLQQDKIRELKIRENEAWERIKNREREVERSSFEQRQRLEKEEEILKYRERDIQKNLQVEQAMVREERERLQKAERDLQKKIQELEEHKTKLEKEQVREVEGFKSELQRKMKDEEFELHRRKLIIEEDEHRIKYTKDQLAMIENRNKLLEGSSSEREKELKEARGRLEKLVDEHRDMQQQLKILNENLRRESELSASKEKENAALVSENRSLKDIMQDLKSTSATYKEDQSQLIENLRLQLNETREIITKMKEGKEKEFRKLKEKYEEERRRESEQFQGEYDKLRNEIGLMQRRLGQEEHFNKELSVLNHKLQNKGTGAKGWYAQEGQEYGVMYEKHKVESHHHYYGEKGVGAIDDGEDSDEELAKRRRAQAELEREEAELKRNIKSLMRLAPESRVEGDPILAERVRRTGKQEDDEAQVLRKKEDLQRERRLEQQKEEQKQMQQSQKRQWTAPSPRKDDLQKREAPKEPASKKQASPAKQPEPKKEAQPKEEAKFSSYEAKRQEEKRKEEKRLEEKRQEEKRQEEKRLEEKRLEEQRKQQEAQKKGAGGGGSLFKGPSFNPFMKKSQGGGEPAKVVEPAKSQFPSLAGQETAARNQSSFKQNENEISENIDENYEEDFEDVVESKKVETKPIFSGNFVEDKKNSDSYSNDFLERDEEEDFF